MTGAPSWWRRDLYPGDEGGDVEALQAILGVPKTRILDEGTLMRVRGFRAAYGLPAQDVVDVSVASVIGDRERTRRGVPPAWFEAGDLGRVEAILGEGGGDAVRRFQSDRGLPPTGVVDVLTAVVLGD